MENIILTADGDELCVVQEDKVKIGDYGSVGQHGGCNGVMEVVIVKAKVYPYRAMFCRKCQLRVEIPIGITTYGLLRVMCEATKLEKR